MPYLNLCISLPESAEVERKIVDVLMKHTSNILGKQAEVTSIKVDFVAPDKWFVGGVPMRDQGGVTFYLDIKVTDGTNKKSEKAEYIKNVFADLGVLLGPITAASYIVIHDVRADAWGFQGQTQEFRYIKSQAL